MNKNESGERGAKRITPRQRAFLGSAVSDDRAAARSDASHAREVDDEENHAPPGPKKNMRSTLSLDQKIEGTEDA